MNLYMTLEDCFEIEESMRTDLINKHILAHLPEESRQAVKQRAIRIVENFVGQDVNALSVLIYAAERGKFDEYAQRLEEHFRESLQYVHPEARRIAQVPGAVRAEVFFINCYKELVIKPQK